MRLSGAPFLLDIFLSRAKCAETLGVGAAVLPSKLESPGVRSVLRLPFPPQRQACQLLLPLGLRPHGYFVSVFHLNNKILETDVPIGQGSNRILPSNTDRTSPAVRISGFSLSQQRVYCSGYPM